MENIFVTGDKHGNFQSDCDYQKIRQFCENHNTTQDDVMIILGDHGIHYDGGWHDQHARKKLSKMPITFVMIRGNHDMRPSENWRRAFVMRPGVMSGWFYEDPYADNILYTDEYGWYDFGGVQTFVICGAYSVDKYYRLEKAAWGETGYRWFPDEQLNDQERDAAYKMFFSEAPTNKPFVIMSHTCPLNMKPTEKLLTMIDQNTVDETMEKWMDNLYLDTLNLGLPLSRWYCGHWHIDKTVEPIRFMYNDIEMMKGTEPWRRV